jgi:hypothetical protein
MVCVLDNVGNFRSMPCVSLFEPSPTFSPLRGRRRISGHTEAPPRSGHNISRRGAPNVIVRLIRWRCHLSPDRILLPPCHLSTSRLPPSGK